MFFYRSRVIFKLSCFCGVSMYFGIFGLRCLFVPELVRTRLYIRGLCWMHALGLNTTYFGSSSCLQAGASSPELRHVLACFAHFFLPKRLSNPRELTTHYFGTWKECWSWQAQACPPHEGCLPDPRFSDIQLHKYLSADLGTRLDTQGKGA